MKSNTAPQTPIDLLEELRVLVSDATEDASTLFETYTGLLAAGTYYADIASFGGHVQDSPTFNAASYFDMGAYFLTGSGFTAADYISFNPNTAIWPTFE